MKQKLIGVLLFLIGLSLLFQNCQTGFRPLPISNSLVGETSICLDIDLCPVTRIERPTFRTEVIMFEDNFIFQPALGVADLVYRAEGGVVVERLVNASGGVLKVGGNGGLVHVAQLSAALLRANLRIVSGAPEIAIAHNGLSDRSGVVNPAPGFKVAFETDSTNIIDLSNNGIVARIGEAVPRDVDLSVGIFWDSDARLMRIDLPEYSYSVQIDKPWPKGGFALRSSISTDVEYTKVQLIWPDNRQLALYDEYNTILNLDGTVRAQIPQPQLPNGMTSFLTVAVDLKRARSFIAFGGADMDIGVHSTVRGFGVRNLATGQVDVFPAPINGCMPLQGGGGLDGFALLQSWITPASLCWLDWGAYDRGDRNNFVVLIPEFQKTGAIGSTFVGFHDSDSALDGSIARYLRVTENFIGINRFFVHPNIARFASFAGERVLNQAPNQQSHTGPYGTPTQLVVRDLDRAWYELWSYTGHGLHTQMRGFNLFANVDDWAGPLYPTTTGASPYDDYANTLPSLTEPGRLWAPFLTWTPSGPSVSPISLHYLSVGSNLFNSIRTIPLLPIGSHAPIQILW